MILKILTYDKRKRKIIKREEGEKRVYEQGVYEEKEV